MLAKDEAFKEMMKIVILTISLFMEMQNNFSFQESLFPLLTSKANTNFL